MIWLFVPFFVIAAPTTQPGSSLVDAPLSDEQRASYRFALEKANKVNALGDSEKQRRVAADATERAHKEQLRANDQRADKYVSKAKGSDRDFWRAQRRSADASADEQRAKKEAAIASAAPALEGFQGAATRFAQAAVHAEYRQMKKAYGAYRAGLQVFATAIYPRPKAVLGVGMMAPAQRAAEKHGLAVESMIRVEREAACEVLQLCHREIGKVKQALAQAGVLAQAQRDDRTLASNM